MNWQAGIQRALVIGAGVGGPVLAMWLRRLGVDVVVAEAREAAAPGEGAFLGVAPNGMSVLETLGVAELVAERGHACDAFQFFNRRDERIGLIDRSRDRQQCGWPLTMIMRGELHAVLAEQARRRGAQLLFGKRLVALDRSRPTEVVARFADGSELSADVLIGADGLRSTVRAQILPDAPAPQRSGLLDFGGIAPPAELPFSRCVNAMVFGRRAFFGAFTTPAGETWWFHNGPTPDPAAPQLQLPPAAARNRLLELHAEDPPWIGELIRTTPDVLGAWPIYDLPAMPRWSDGRVGLLGDAAHAMSPSAGQGASLAMEDAMVLAQCLRDVADPARALELYRRRRHARVDAIFRQARRNGSGKAMASPLSEWFRDRLLPVFLRLGAAAQSRSYSYRIDWEQPSC